LASARTTFALRLQILSHSEHPTSSFYLHHQHHNTFNGVSSSFLLTVFHKGATAPTVLNIMALFTPLKVFLLAILLRVVFFFYGLWQDANSPMKYTDIDYYVFTDAARFTARGASPYDRDTYRYTPLLAWLLLPTSWSSQGGAWFSFGKLVFALGDLVAGWLMYMVLRSNYGMSRERSSKYASIWLLNPMVATISTRGSSEGLLGVIVMALLWATLQRRIVLAGILLGLAVHFKIYPFIYAPSIIWWLDNENLGNVGKEKEKEKTTSEKVLGFVNPARVRLTLVSLATFSGLNVMMFLMLVLPFLIASN
jgi:GPI mannosyltransferase 1 subunit M